MERRKALEQFFASTTDFFRAIHVGKERLAQKSGANRSQVELLMRIKHQPLTIGQIAEQMRMTSSAATQLVEGLADLGWVERESDIHDKRKVHVKISTKGAEHLHKAKEYFLDYLQQRMENVPDSDLQHAAECLNRIAEKMAKE
jgi:DNA-binding MarR family transcriptional regulator